MIFQTILSTTVKTGAIFSAEEPLARLSMGDMVLSFKERPEAV
jgi:hypothetical protein